MFLESPQNRTGKKDTQFFVIILVREVHTFAMVF
jgi:hypothetical protein